MPRQKTLTFEDRIQRLSIIVQTLENGMNQNGEKLSLEDTLKLYREGSEYATLCREQLKSVQNEIKILNQHENTTNFFSVQDKKEERL